MPTRTAQWLIRIVENLLSITGMAVTRPRSTKTPGAPRRIIEGAVGKFTRRWGTDIPVEVRLPEEFLLVPMDPLLMEQVLTNLMENAVLHGKTTRHITVTLCRSGDWARFIVEDDGQGIAPDRLEHLFDGTLQGQQGDRGRSMGIGLSALNGVALGVLVAIILLIFGTFLEGIATCVLLVPCCGPSPSPWAWM